jgi:hypothetical protein
MFNIHSTSASTGHKTYGPRNVAKLATAVITLREATGEKKRRPSSGRGEHGDVMVILWWFYGVLGFFTDERQGISWFHGYLSYNHGDSWRFTGDLTIMRYTPVI